MPIPTPMSMIMPKFPNDCFLTNMLLLLLLCVQMFKLRQCIFRGLTKSITYDILNKTNLRFINCTKITWANFRYALWYFILKKYQENLIVLYLQVPGPMISIKVSNKYTALTYILD